MSDYYKILGIERNATQDEIKKSFRKLAQKYHPDKSTGDESKFKEINEAYETLSDPDKRRSYDGGGSNFHQNFNQGFSGFDDMFNNIFGQHHQFHRTHHQTSSRKPVGFNNLDFEIALELDLSESYKGTKRNLRYKSRVYCEPCSGFGSTLTICKGCNGSGMKSQKQGFMIFNSTCNQCFGLGQAKDPNSSCKSCSGSGFSLEDQILDLDIPAGSGHIETTTRLNVQGKGSRFGSQRGSLAINVTVKKQNQFKQDGLNLLTKAKVKFSDLILGKKIEVQLPDRTTTSVKLEPNTNLGENYKVKKMGMPQPGSTFRGDLIVALEIILPDSLTSEQEDLLKRLGQLDL